MHHLYTQMLFSSKVSIHAFCRCREIVLLISHPTRQPLRQLAQTAAPETQQCWGIWLDTLATWTQQQTGVSIIPSHNILHSTVRIQSTKRVFLSVWRLYVRSPAARPVSWSASSPTTTTTEYLRVCRDIQIALQHTATCTLHTQHITTSATPPVTRRPDTNLSICLSCCWACARRHWRICLLFCSVQFDKHSWCQKWLRAVVWVNGAELESVELFEFFENILCFTNWWVRPSILSELRRQHSCITYTNPQWASQGKLLNVLASFA